MTRKKITDIFIDCDDVVGNSIAVPIGTIIQVHPEILNPLNSVWVKCDGVADLGTNFNTPTNKVPDLSDERFLMGISHTTTIASSDGSNVMVNHKHSTNSTDLNLSCICTTSGSVGSLGTCNVSLASGATNSTGAHAHSFASFSGTYVIGTNSITSWSGVSHYTSSDGNHSHTVSGTTNIAHSHTYNNSVITCTVITGSIGDGANDVSITENRPQYFTVHYYMRIQ